MSRAELQGVLWALSARLPGERLIVVLDLEYVYKGTMEWSPKWTPHGWRTASREVVHRYLWEAILFEREAGDEAVQLRWVSSHLGVPGNQQADSLAKKGWKEHPNNAWPCAKRLCARPEPEALGKQEMPSPDHGAADSGGSTSSSDAERAVNGSDESSQFSADVSERARERAAQTRGWGSYYSMGISETRRAKHSRVIKRPGVSHGGA